jgi:hypothetical protein
MLEKVMAAVKTSGRKTPYFLYKRDNEHPRSIDTAGPIPTNKKGVLTPPKETTVI